MDEGERTQGRKRRPGAEPCFLGGIGGGRAWESGGRGRVGREIGAGERDSLPTKEVYSRGRGAKIQFVLPRRPDSHVREARVMHSIEDEFTRWIGRAITRKSKSFPESLGKS